MTSQVSALVRSGLVRARVAAMTGGVDSALAGIGNLRGCGVPGAVDAAAIGLLESEINFLDGRPKAALDAFAAYVEPALPDIDPRTATVIADNKSSVLLDAFAPEAADLFYHLVDQRRILGVELRDYAAILDADGKAAKGKHSEALPTYWRQLRAAYRLQNWRAMAIAESDFARECMGLGWLSKAAYHAMLARDKETMQPVADALLAARSPDQLRATLDKLLRASSLKKHAMQVALLLHTVADVVPEDQLVEVIRWLGNWAIFMPTGWHDAPLFEGVWEAIGALSSRMSFEVSASFVSSAIGHPLMAGGVPRRYLIGALNLLCARLSGEPLMPLANAAIALVRERKSDIDYTDSMNLLCQVAHCGGDEIKAHIRASLLPPATLITDTVLLQAAHHLGWTPQHPEKFSEHARFAAAAIRQQVQHLAPGEAPARIGGLGTVNGSTASGHNVVHIRGAEHLVHALIPYRHMIDAPSIADLLRAMLAMVAESDNLVTNRASLALLLRECVDCVPDGLDGEIAGVLEPLADGQIVESSIGQTHAQAINPLNPFKMGSGNPVDLRGAALLALAKLDHAKPSSSPRFHKDLLLKALTSPNADVRRYALAAAEVNGLLTPAEQIAVALAGLDREPEVAGLAMRALSQAADSLRFSRQMWHIVLRCLEAAVQSRDAGHRGAAAQVVNAVSAKKIPSELRERFASVTAALCVDICYSVRASLAEPRSWPRAESSG